jgi:hypothetical protein
MQHFFSKTFKFHILFFSALLLFFNLQAQTLDQTFYIDFGQDNPGAKRHLTLVDDNGNHWNNVVAPNGSPSTLNAGASFDLISADNKITPYVLEVTRAIKSNGGDNGGLFSPDAALLGDLAVSTATEDYFFLDNNMGKGLFTFKNLQPEKAYKFYIFGTRVAAGAQRGVVYSLSGKNGSHGAQLNTGTGIGANDYNGNNNNVWVSIPVFPTDAGEIMLEMGRLFNNQMAYISALKIEEYSEVALPEVERSFFIDFGKNNDGLDGQRTIRFDEHGNYWNNVYSNGDNWTVGASDGSGNIDLYDAAGDLTDFRLEMMSEVRFNGVRNGALGGNDSPNEPKAELLGDLAIKTATFDYLYIENESQRAEIHFKNLNRNKQYVFHVLGSRKDDGNNGRVGRMSIIGGNAIMGIHQMGGAGIGANGENYNNKNIFISDPIVPDADGKINLTMTQWLGFAHINCIKVEEVEGEPFPELESISITGGDAISKCGQALQLSVQVSPVGALLPRVVWRVSNSDIARITETGKLYPLANGTVTVYANVEVNDAGYLVETKDIIISGQNIDDYSFTVMGSSVPWGQGAEPRDKNGYAWLWTDYLKQKSENNWVTNNISIGGNKTTDVTNRWDNDLLPACSRYVYYGLSLGNEGIHERGQAAYDSWHDNMLLLIDRARAHGKEPIVGNNYPRGDFNATDYNYLKQLNLEIHQWDVASVNLLGSIDNGAGKWASGFIADNAHPNTAGHAEMFYSIVPSLMDALAAEKPQPVRDNEGEVYLINRGIGNQISFEPENILHSFTLSFSFKTTGTGTIASLVTATNDTLSLELAEDGRLTYQTQTSVSPLNDDSWHTVSLTHYFGWAKTQLYIDGERIPRSPVISERLVPVKFILGDFNDAPEVLALRELFLYRSGMCAEEIAALEEGKMLKSSLEIYAPLHDNQAAPAELVNLAQSLNTIQREENHPSGLVDNPQYDDEKNIHAVKIYTLTGQEVFHATALNNDFRTMLPEGVYLARIITHAQQIFTHKILIQ